MLFQIYLYITKIEGAPKFGNALYDPLTYEAMKHGELEYNNPPYMQARTQDNGFDGADDDDFLENSESEKETLSVPPPTLESQTETKIETTSALINNPITISETMQTKRSSPLDNLTLRKIITGNLAKSATKHIEQITTPVSKIPNNEKTVAIARSSCTSCVGNVQNYRTVALRQGVIGGDDSVKKSGYDYDEKLCKIINGRILCGYNKNIGEIQDDKVIFNIDDNCQMRDDRIECGYVPGNKSPNVARDKLPIDDLSAELIDLPLDNSSTKTEILRGASLILINGVRDSPESLGYSTIDNNNFSEPDSKTTKLNQIISDVNSQKNVPTLEKIADTTTTASTVKSVDMASLSNTEPVELSNTYFDNVNNAIGNFEPTPPPQSHDNPDVIDYVTTVNESINFVAEAQVERRLEEDGQLSDTNGPAFNKNFDRNYVQNPNSIKEENEPHVEVTSDASNYKKVTRCVEIGDRIVCYNIQLKDITPHM